MVQGQCKHFLAGAALTEQQHRRIARRDLLDRAADPQQFGIPGHETGQRVGRLHLPQSPVLALQFGQAECPADDQAQHVGIEGLGKEVVGPEVDRPQRVGLVVLARQHDDLDVRIEFEHLRQQLEAFHVPCPGPAEARGPSSRPRANGGGTAPARCRGRSR